MPIQCRSREKKKSLSLCCCCWWTVSLDGAGELEKKRQDSGNGKQASRPVLEWEFENEVDERGRSCTRDRASLAIYSQTRQVETAEDRTASRNAKCKCRRRKRSGRCWGGQSSGRCRGERTAEIRGDV
ncbi:hypothetical protein CCHR01_13565 [Colletotrichum chrysophilum]|uniref:Uncharacterized protein n=1 Tax=Colletotrichum chrysophilum TaxID=1836956 RepID=A0AAD9A952_9PEZI|nr:hypothetical protein CCHR01_13565 [Colletotrichum chrysophilum]